MRKRISMNKVREIIRLKNEGFSDRKIARALRVSRPVVAKYLLSHRSSGLDSTETSGLADDALLEALAGTPCLKRQRYKDLAAQFEYFVKELKRTGVTLRLLWEEYKKEKSNVLTPLSTGFYEYSQFCHHFQVWRKDSKLTMHIDHKAGDKMFCDFTGKKFNITDWLSGSRTEVEVFIAVLGASGLTYVEAVASQKKEDWILANENALHYFGGVPLAIVPDNLKSGVTKADKHEPDLNPEYADFGRHYGVVILPARPYKPKDKALVENAVGIVYAWIFARLRNRIFNSLTELNRVIRQELEAYNSRPMQKLKVSRRQLFNDIEKAVLKPLPVERYELRNFASVKVAFNYHVHLRTDDHYYSVPYRFRGKQVNLIFTVKTLEIYCNNVRIASHVRVKNSSGKYTTVKEHRHPTHTWADDWTPERFIHWAGSIGEPTKKLIEKILSQAVYPEQAFKTCMGVIQLKKKYDSSRLNKACGRALNFQSYTYKMVRSILENGMENICEEQRELPLPLHENIRGEKYYGCKI